MIIHWGPFGPFVTARLPLLFGWYVWLHGLLFVYPWRRAAMRKSNLRRENFFYWDIEYNRKRMRDLGASEAAIDHSYPKYTPLRLRKCGIGRNK